VSLGETLGNGGTGQRDSERDLAPLRRADDAIAIDSSSLDAEALAQRVMHEIRKNPLCKLIKIR
jgi:cytidylate kinase